MDFILLLLGSFLIDLLNLSFGRYPYCPSNHDAIIYVFWNQLLILTQTGLLSAQLEIQVYRWYMAVSRKSSLQVSYLDHPKSPFMVFEPDVPLDFYYECNWTLVFGESDLETFDFDSGAVPESCCFYHLYFHSYLFSLVQQFIFVFDSDFVFLWYCLPGLVCCFYALRFSLTLWHLTQYWHGLAQYQIHRRFHHLYYQTHPVPLRTLRIIGTSRQLSVRVLVDFVGDHGLFSTLSNFVFSSVLSRCLRGSHSNWSLSCFLWHYPTDFWLWFWCSLSGFACQQEHLYSNWAATADQKCCLCCLMLCCF